MDTTTRSLEAREALEAVVAQYRDVFGPLCWCDHTDDCETTPCPSIPPTTEMDAWVLVMEWSELDPDGDASTRWISSRNCGPNRRLGMLARAARYEEK